MDSKIESKLVLKKSAIIGYHIILKSLLYKPHLRMPWAYQSSPSLSLSVS